jgi:SAM-dependent methyltransferase
MKEAAKKIILFFHNLFSVKKRTSRELFLKKLNANDKILEIGPFTNPSLRGENIYYFDVLNKENLIKRAKEENYPITEIPEINFVSPHGDLTIIKEEFDNAYSSHCIEHQTDLIKHLVDVNAILKPGGKYYLVIPDKRYCFDALLPETNVAAILEAHYEKKTRHSLANVIQHGALTAHHSPYRHWLGDHGTIEDMPDKIKTVLRQYNEKKGAYFDVHSWRFTPDSFAKLIDLLYKMNYIDLTVSEIYHTTFASNEFYAVLQKNR